MSQASFKAQSDSHMNTNRNRCFALMWLLTLIVLRQLLPDSAFADGFTAVYTVLAYGSYAAIYLGPTFIITWLLESFARAGQEMTLEKGAVCYSLAGNQPRQLALCSQKP